MPKIKHAHNVSVSPFSAQNPRLPAKSALQKTLARNPSLVSTDSPGNQMLPPFNGMDALLFRTQLRLPAFGSLFGLFGQVIKRAKGGGAAFCISNKVQRM